MRRIRKTCLGGLLLLAALWAVGCGRQAAALPSLYDGEVAAYAHPSCGAAFMTPASWEKLDEDGQSVVFAGADGNLSFTAYLELGGFSYYSDEGLRDIGAAVCEQTLEQAEILRSGRFASGGQVVTSAGVIRQEGGEEVNAVCEVVILSPLSAVRYYLVCVASVDAYAANSRLLEEVYLSFYVDKSEDELYEGLHRDDE